MTNLLKLPIVFLILFSANLLALTDDETALFTAVQNGDTNTIKSLIMLQVDVNVIDEEGYTPLHRAVFYNKLDSANELLAYAKTDKEARLPETAIINNWYMYGVTPLILASYLGYTDIVESLIKYKANTKARDNVDGTMPIHIAAANGHIEITELLLLKDKKLSRALDNYGSSPLHWASMSNNPEIVAILLENGADANIEDGNGIKAIDYAKNISKNKEIIDMLSGLADSSETTTTTTTTTTTKVKPITPIETTTITTTTKAKPLETTDNTKVKALEPIETTTTTTTTKVKPLETTDNTKVKALEPIETTTTTTTTKVKPLETTNNTKVKALEPMNETDTKDGSPDITTDNTNEKTNIIFKIDSVDKAPESAKTIIENPSVKNLEFIVAVKKGDIITIKKLIAEGVNPNFTLENGYTPLHIAINENKIESIEELLLYEDLEIDIMGNIPEISNWEFGYSTPLFLASALGNDKIVSLLINNNADIHYQNEVSGIMPIHLASYYKHNNIVEMLIEKDNSVLNAYSSDNRTALHYAVISEGTELTSMLLEYPDIDHNAKDILSKTPLHYAVAINNLEIVKLLSNNGADKTIKDEDNYTPYLLAVSLGHKDIADFLNDEKKNKVKWWILN